MANKTAHTDGKLHVYRRPVFAYEGWTVTCVNGHDMYRFKRDIPNNALMRSEDVEGLNGLPDPEPNSPFPLCPACGESFIKPNGGVRVKEPSGADWEGVVLN